jgi:hypothetical protein
VRTTAATPRSAAAAPAAAAASPPCFLLVATLGLCCQRNIDRRRGAEDRRRFGRSCSCSFQHWLRGQQATQAMELSDELGLLCRRRIVLRLQRDPLALQRCEGCALALQLRSRWGVCCQPTHILVHRSYRS